MGDLAELPYCSTEGRKIFHCLETGVCCEHFIFQIVFSMQSKNAVEVMNTF